MILKSYLIEKDITLLDKYFITLIYGENIGMKDDIKNEIKKFFNDYEKITFTQDEILKDYQILNEQVDNTSLFSQKKIIFISEVSDKMKDLISEILENLKNPGGSPWDGGSALANFRNSRNSRNSKNAPGRFWHF